MPIEELLAQYGYGGALEPENSDSSSDVGEESSQTAHTSLPPLAEGHLGPSGVVETLPLELDSATGQTGLPNLDYMQERPKEAGYSILGSDQPGPSGLPTSTLPAPNHVHDLDSDDRLHCAESLGDVPRLRDALMHKRNDVMPSVKNSRVNDHVELSYRARDLVNDSLRELGWSGVAPSRKVEGTASIGQKRSRSRGCGLRPEVPERR